MSENKRTEVKFWDKYWHKHKKGSGRVNLLMKDIYDTFIRYLPSDKNIQVLEIGGAYGEYLMFLYHSLHYRISSLDYSTTGNVATIEKFKQAGVPIQIIERDLFSDISDLPKFDIVYSLGFIEHFDDLTPVVSKHVELVKPGGILLLGIPNLGGIYKRVLRKIAPSFEETHNLDTMNLDSWKNFEEKLNLQPIFKGYIGGFEPMTMKKLEKRSLVNITIYSIVTALTLLLSFSFRFLRRYNSAYLSGYMIGIYKTPD